MLPALPLSTTNTATTNDPGRDYEKQDCEQKAFVRLAAKIKKYFPRLPVCILGDGLYPNNTTFDICQKNGWQFIITLKDGNLKTFQQEVALLKATSGKRNVYRATKTARTTLQYEYLNDINLGYELEHKFSRVSFVAMQNYYQLLQIAHIINQLVERSKQVVAVLAEHSKQTIVDLWRKMTAYLIFSHAEENIQKPSLPD